MTNVTDLRKRALHALATPAFAPFKMADILPPDPHNPARAADRKTHWTATATALYMTRTRGSDRFGILPTSYLAKAADLVAHGRRYPLSRPPLRFQDGPLIWQEADEAAALSAGPAALHAILTLPTDCEQGWERLLVEFIDAEITARGAITDWAIHSLGDNHGGWTVHPHAHLLITCRRWCDDKQCRKGRPQPQWWAGKDQRTALSPHFISLRRDRHADLRRGHGCFQENNK
jgi:MobA/MobL family